VRNLTARDFELTGVDTGVEYTQAMRIPSTAALVCIVSVSSALAQQAEKPRPMPGPASGPAVHNAAKPAPPPPTAPAQAAPPSTPAPPPAAAQPSSPFAAGPFTYAPRYNPGQRPRPPNRWGSGSYGFGAPYEVIESPRTDESRNPPDEQLTIDGVLFLDVEPHSVDVYVDGFYVGSSEDFALDGLPLRAGRHWLDLRASGYETLTLPVNITAAQAVRYRGGLTLARTTPAPAEPSRAPQTIYVITGCYAGNRPPVASALPTGCDISRLRALDPR
jgi:hypothetical protein